MVARKWILATYLGFLKMLFHNFSHNIAQIVSI